MEAIDSIRDMFEQLTLLQIGVALVVLVFLIIGLRLVFKKPPAHLTAFSGEAGSVLVSRKALQELVRTACLLEEWVEAARPVIRVRDNKVTARVELRISRPDNLKAICQRVQDHITTLLNKSLNFDQIGEIQIIVKSFGSENGEKAGQLDKAESGSTLLTDSRSTLNPAPGTVEVDLDHRAEGSAKEQEDQKS